MFLEATKNIAGAVVLQLLLVWWTRAEFVYNNLFDYKLNLTSVYSNPGHVYGEDLLRTTVFYLDELMELEDALEDEEEEKKAIKMLSDLYHDGGPKHLNQIPYNLFIDTYNWTNMEIDDFAGYIEKTKESWNRLLVKIRKYVKSGKIAEINTNVN